MNNRQTLLINSHQKGQLFLGATTQTRYLWNSLKIEKHNSKSWALKLYNRSILHDFWTVLSSEVG